MKSIKTCLLAALLSSGTLLAVPSLVNYQGFVTDSDGNPIGMATPVNRKIIFKVYDAATAGNLLWAEEHTATLSDGRFSVLLGNGAQYLTNPHGSVNSIFESGTDYYIGITVDDGDGTLNETDTEISPRQRIVSSVFALRAATADSVASGKDLSLGTDNGLGYYDSSRQFNGLSVNGPVLYGAGGGALGAQSGNTQTTALRWDSSGNITASGNASITGTLGVTGQTSLQNVGIAGTLGVTGQSTLQNTSIGGTLGVTGQSTLQNTSIGGTLGVTGQSTLQNTSIGGTLGVTGETTTTGILYADGGIQLGGFGPNTDFVGTSGNFLAFGHEGQSEDFIGYKSNTFYFRDSPQGGDTAHPHVDVGGNLIVGGDASIGGSLDIVGDLEVNSRPVTNGEEALRIVRGLVRGENNNLFKEGGSGFTCRKATINGSISQGVYEVTFDTPFSAPPTITTNYVKLSDSYNQDRLFVTVYNPSTTGFRFIVLGDDGGYFVNEHVNFIAVGPR